MNILFLVFGFILIFLFFSATLLKQTIFFSSEQKSCCAYIEAKHKIHDKLERYKYKSYDEKLTKTKTSSKKREKKIKQEGSYRSHRLFPTLSSQAKWNLAPLISEKKPISYLEEATICFLESLYGHADFWKKEKIQNPELAQALLDSFKNKVLPEKISDLFPEELSLQPIFYKMLKGSGYYDLASQQGYPPLEDYFRLEKENTYTLSLPYACLPALEALLGDVLTSKVLQIEKEKFEKKEGYHSISKKEFTELINHLGLHVSIQEWDALLQKDKKKVKLEKIIHKEGKRAPLQIPLP